MRLRLFLAAAAPITLAVVLTNGASATERTTQAAPQILQPPAQTEQQRSTSSRAVDTSDKQQVASAYRQLWLPADQSRPRWLGGNVRRCRAGRLAGHSTNRQVGAINFARLLVGLTPVALDPATVGPAQEAALMMTAEDAVSHHPSPSWTCWTQAGSEAAAQSNLYQGIRRETNAEKIEAYLDDWGGINTDVGHRRLLLHPGLTAIGIGGTATANVSHLFGQPFNEAAPNPEWVSWPAAGWFPSTLDPRGRWSLSSGNDTADFSQARVRVTFRGERVRGVEVNTLAASPGKPTLVWEMPRPWPEVPVGKARVEVTGIAIDGVPGLATDYTVRFFRSR